MRLLISVIVLMCVVLTTVGTKLCEKKCYLGQPCMPTTEWVRLGLSLDGEIIWPDHPLYHQVNTVYNQRVKTDPIVIVFVNNADDVKKCLNFTKTFNIRVSVMSTGLSYIGRSTHAGSFQINLSKLKNVQVKAGATNRSPGGEVTAETGSTWGKVFEEVDKHNRIVVGARSNNVGVSGFTQGGGHSPLSRSLGLAVDNLLEVQMATVDGHLVTVSANGTFNHDTGVNSTNTDLFWALRGGGGGTWGVIISMTFKLHIPPSAFVFYAASYDIVNGNTSLQNVISLVENLPKEWGGSILMATIPTAKFYLNLLHYGPQESESFKAIDVLFHDENAGETNLLNTSFSFWDYQKTVTDPDISTSRTYAVNSLIEPSKSGNNLANVVIELMSANASAAIVTGCALTMLGGKVGEALSGSTPISPGFRSASFSLVCGRVWQDPLTDTLNIGISDRFSTRLQEFGEGVYFSETAENLDNWKKAYWGKGDNYEKLLKIKKNVDPTNVLCCHNCVGFDLEEEEEKKPDDKACPSSGSKQMATLSLLILTNLLLNF